MNVAQVNGVSYYDVPKAVFDDLAAASAALNRVTAYCEELDRCTEIEREVAADLRMLIADTKVRRPGI